MGVRGVDDNPDAVLGCQQSSCNDLRWLSLNRNITGPDKLLIFTWLPMSNLHQKPEDSSLQVHLYQPAYVRAPRAPRMTFLPTFLIVCEVMQKWIK